MLGSPIVGSPGVGSTYQTAYRRAFFAPMENSFLAGGKTIDGTYARDPGNSLITVLRPGLLLGKRTTGGFYAPSIIGVSTGAIIATATSITVSAAEATEIVRRIGATGTLRFVGPPSAAGTVATFTETYSAVNTTTGVITISAADAALIAGSFVCADDGTYLPKSFVPDGYGIQVADSISGSNVYAQEEKIAIAGLVDFAQLLPAATDTSLIAWVKEKLKLNGPFAFSNDF